MTIPYFSARSLLTAAALGLSLIIGATSAAPARADVTAPQRADIEAVIHDYLLQHPEILREALTELDRKEKAQEAAARISAVSTQKATIFDSSHQAVVGNPNGTVTLVEFFDYNCGYCKQSLADIGQLIKNDPNLRVVLKDFPILSPGSVEASHIAIALRSQFKGDKYWQFHSRLLAMRGAIGKAQALALAKDMGADMVQLARDTESDEVRSSLQEVAVLADSLALTGTPSFVIGQDVVVGALGYDEIKSKLDSVRKCGKVSCG